ncbi:MAG: DNA-binding response regulator [Planctomycetota bacterium]|nr:MAG: DNA-binding response regulator [Planctomycetota bacterium]
MTPDPIRVLCVDDHAFMADGLRARFDQEPGIELAGRRSSADGLLGAVDETAATVVLMDIEMPGPDPFEAIENLARHRPDVRAILFSAFVRDHYIDQAVAAGAWGYLSKGDPPDDVVRAIRAVAAGEFAMSREVADRAAGPGPKAPEPDTPRSKLALLTPREIQVLRLIGRGLSRVEIAQTLHRSPKTIDVHRASIMEKLGVNDRVDLVRFALREGLAEL